MIYEKGIFIQAKNKKATANAVAIIYYQEINVQQRMAAGE